MKTFNEENLDSSSEEELHLERENQTQEWVEPKREDGQDIEDGTFLNRRSILTRHRSRREYAVFGLFLIGLGILAAVLVFGGKKDKKAIQQEEEFQMPDKRAISLTKPPPQIPQPLPKEDKIDKNALALKDARLKSAIVIYQNNSPAKTQAADSSERVGASDPNQRFQDQAQSLLVQTSHASNIGNLETKILQGKMIDVVMETAINSDLPGMVRAIVSYDVYGETGRIALLPRGTRLIGAYNSAIRKGQARVFVIWNRALRPDGIEIALNSGGTDPLGRSGIGGDVNNHFWQIFGTSTLLSLIGAGAANVGVDSGDQNNSMSAYREELANSFRDSASKVLNSYIDNPPTISIKQGTRMKVIVARDLEFSGALAEAPSIQFGGPRQPWVSKL